LTDHAVRDESWEHASESTNFALIVECVTVDPFAASKLLRLGIKCRNSFKKAHSRFSRNIDNPTVQGGYTRDLYEMNSRRKIKNQRDLLIALTSDEVVEAKQRYMASIAKDRTRRVGIQLHRIW
jgi:hypothetical protein